MAPETNQGRDLFWLNLAMIFIATSGAFGRSLTVSPELGIFWRSVIGVAALYAYSRWRGISWQLPSGRPRRLIVLSGVLMTLHWVAYFYALKWSNVAVAMVAVFTYPAITALLEPLFFRSAFRWPHLLLAALILGGVYLMSPGFSLADDLSWGILAGLVSATVYAFRNLLMKTQVTSVNGSVLMGWQAVAAVVLLSPYLFLDFKLPPPANWWPLLGLGLVTTALGHTMFLRSFKHFSVTTASLISSIQPVYGILFGWLLLGERPSGSVVSGGFLILASVMLEAWRAGRSAH